jgi:hypothetical protein
MAINLTRKSVYLAGTIGLIAGMAYYAVGKIQAAYQYRTDIFIGDYASSDSFQPLDVAASLVGFVNDKLLTGPTTEELMNLRVDEIGARVLMSVVDSGKSVRLRSIAGASDLEQATAIHRYLADQVLERLKARSLYLKTRLSNRLVAAQEALNTSSSSLATYSELNSTAKVSETRIKELADKLGKEIAELDRRQQGVSPSVPATADDELVGLSRRQQLALFEKLASAEIPQLRNDSSRAIAEVQKTMMESQQRIREYTNEMSAFHEPAISEFMQRSVKPAGPSGLIRLLIGFFAGFLLYFAARYIRRVVLR